MKFSTKCVHGKNDRSDTKGAISYPIYQSSTFAHPGVNQSTGYDYSRLQNPTREQLENLVATLEDGFDAIAFSTGMAAMSTCMELFSPGDHIIVSDDMYGGTNRLFHNVSAKNGIQVDFMDTTNVSIVSEHIKKNTKAIFVETPTNPMMNVTDIRAITELAKSHGLLTIVDNTFLTPYFQKPISLGADIVLHSGTKYLGGHNDTLAGFLVVNSMELSEKLRFLFKTTGACLSPFDSWLLIRGIKTLSLRMEQHNANAIKVANWLTTHKKVKEVYYVGLESHKSYGITQKQTTGFGGMISFRVDSEKTAIHILESVQVIQYAESLGGVESLITFPMLQTHADVCKEERDAKGINETLLRLSVGIENADDIIADLQNAIG